jgi:asparagine synthase (glutamine-hydrolysing)
MANEDDSVWVVFNGEIFNYLELRAELIEAGHRFRTTSDTEVIVHAYEQFGDGFLGRLNGQFAIALWDRHGRRLVLARDRAGIRPLYVAEEKGRVLFASEVKALREVLRAPLRLDARGLAEVFTFWSPVDPRTVYAGIQSLPPAHRMIIERGRTRIDCYWNWSDSCRTTTQTRSFDEAAEALRGLLIDAIRLQLRADVPVAAYLSGGLDSSAIVSLIRSSTDVPLRTFSVAFEDEEFDESGAQQEMVRYLGTDHSTVVCRRADIAAAFERVVRHAETPVLRTAPAPLLLLSGLVRESGYKVTLTGEGADEIFGGYDLFKEAKIRRFWAREPESAARAALLGMLYPYLRHSPVGNRSFAQSFYGQGLTDVDDPFYAHRPRWATTRRLWSFFSPDLQAALRGWDPIEERRAALPRGFAALEGLARDQYTEAKTLLAGYLLSSQGDRMAMANSVEGRFPYLDHRVIEFANELPARFKLRGLKEKAVLRRAVRKDLPPAVLNRVKQPYRAPDSSSFFADGRPLEFVAELLGEARIRESGYFNPAAVTRLVEKCRTGRAIGFGDNMAFVGILSTQLVDDWLVRGSAVREARSTARWGQ